jgi:hypothetical protein
MEGLMNNFMFGFRQSQANRLEDALVIKFGEHARMMPKAHKRKPFAHILRLLL